MTKKPKLTPKQAKIVKAKVQAEVKDIPQRVWASTIYPNATPKSAEVLVSRELNKVNVQEALQVALHQKGLTPDAVVDVVAEGMKATKIVTSHTEPDKEMADHSIRLKAAGMAAGFMGLNTKSDSGNTFNNYGTVVTEQKDKYAD